MKSAPIEYPLVEDAGALARVIEQIGSSDLLAIDTEFIRESTYFPELSVLQLATPRMLAAIDCLGDIDLGPLFAALAANGKSWLLHSARQDLEVLFYRARTLPERLVDTQIAAALLGLPLQIGLQGLLEEILDVRIDKQHTRADWGRRPLPDALQQYALDDVRYLLPAWDRLRERLSAHGRLTWLEEECARQLALPIEPDLRSLFDRTKGAGSLRGRQRAAAFALLAWREQRARARNRPRRWILADDELVRIAERLPETRADLVRIPDLPKGIVEHSGVQILETISNAAPVEEAPETAAPDRALVKAMHARVRDLAESVGIQPELLATRRDIVQAAAGRPPDILSSGWRRTVLGEALERIRQDRAS